MKTPQIVLLACMFLLFSCDKNNEMTVNLKTSGELTVHIADSQGNSIQNTKIKLYDVNIQNGYLDALITDSNGEANFGDILSGSYLVVADTPKVNNIKYIPEKNIQIIAGLSKKVNINVQEYIGTLYLTFKKPTYLGGGPFAGLDVLIVPIEKYIANDAIANHIAKAEFSGKTDAKGIISFNIPSSRSFRLIIYNSRKTRKNSLNTYELLMEELKKVTYSIDTSMVQG